MKLKLLFISLLFLTLLFYFSLPDNKARLIFCKVGQGDGALLQRGTFQLLIDTGSANGAMVDCLAKNMPFWDKTLEMVIVSHWDSDHSGGLNELKKYYKIISLYSNEQINYSEKLNESDIIRSNWFGFDVVSSGVGKDDNDKSVVGVLGVGGMSVLFSGDASSEVEQRLVWRQIINNKIDILKVSHHGSKEGTSEELLEIVRPKTAIISVGKNSFGHPTKEVLERLQKYGVQVCRTDLEGSCKYSLF